METTDRYLKEVLFNDIPRDKINKDLETNSITNNN